MSSENKKPLTLQDFVDFQKTKYATEKGIQASNDYIRNVQPYVTTIEDLEKITVDLNKEIKDLKKKIPKEQRVKIIKNKKK